MTVATVWSPNQSKNIGDIVCPTNGVDGMFFRVTTPGTTDSTTEPSWTKIIGESVYDNNIVYEAFSSIFNDISKINPGSVIELFTLTLKTALHGANTVYRFHSGSNETNQNIVWAGNSYTRFPIVAEGFAFQRGQLPRPKLVVSNAFGTISAILQSVRARRECNESQRLDYCRDAKAAMHADLISCNAQISACEKSV